jgi:mono/diheme cytochrome c family protein
VIKGIVIGFVLAIAISVGCVFYYFSAGMAPVATADPPMPFEKKLANMALDAHIEKQHIPPSPVSADEPNFLAGASVYKQHCALCHGLPGQPPMDYATTVFPKPPQLFRGKGVTDDPASETYWKAANGIRLSGMPSFKTKLTETQLWQVSELLAHANEIPESVKRVLIPDSPTAASAPPLTRSSASTCCAWARSKLLSIDAHNFRRQDGHTCRKIATSLIDQRSKRVMAC